MSVTDPPDMTPLPGYSVGREIGAGSFARVYIGNTTTTTPPRTVAVKSVLRSRLTQKLLDNLESEISILKGIRHPHIVSLIDIINTGSHIHLIMEYCPLGDLSFFIKRREKLARNGQITSQYPNTPGAGLNENMVRHFLVQLASALEFLRSKNLMHRDVKPQNLLLLPPPGPLAPDGSQIGFPDLPVLKLADFGFARYLQTASLAETLCGSPLYMAPEILRYEKYDASADLWSLGTVLYEMMVGKPPFRAANLMELLRVIDKCNDEIKFPPDVLFNSELQFLVRALLKRNPRDRITFDLFFAHPILHGRRRQETHGPSDVPVRPNSESPFSRQLRLRENARHSQGPQETVRISVTAEGAQTTFSPISTKDLIRNNTPPSSAQSRAPPSKEKALDRVPGVDNNRSTDFKPYNQDKTKALSSVEGADIRQVAPSTLTRLSSTDAASRATSEGEASGRSRESQSPRPMASTILRPREKDKDPEAEYVLVEKKTVEVNAFADAMAQSPRFGSLARRPSMQVARTPSQQGTWRSSSPSQALNANTVQTLAMAECRLGSSPASALAKAVSIASQKLFGGGSPPAWLENMVHPNSAPKGNTRAQIVGPWSVTEEMRSPDEEELLRNLEDVAMKSNIVYDFAELKLHQLIPPPPSHSSDELDSVLTNEAVVSLCEEAIVLYLKTLQLLQKNIDLVQEWLQQDVLTGASTCLNHIVQWTRQRYNEVLEKAEYLQQKKSTTLSSVATNYPFEEVTAEKLLYDRALEISRGAAINEIVGESLSHCEDDYEVSILMLEAILEAPPRGIQMNGIAASMIEDEDRKMIEKWARLTRSRLEKLRGKMESARRLLQERGVADGKDEGNEQGGLVSGQ